MPSVVVLLLLSIDSAHKRAFALPIRIVVVSRINHVRQEYY
jgi:hypothetical protein